MAHPDDRSGELASTPRTDALCRKHLDGNFYAADALRDLRLHAESLERSLSEEQMKAASFAHKLERDAVLLSAETKARIELERSLADETQKQARLARIAELALTDIRTHSRDVDDYLETLEYIAAIANGLKEPT